jgi:hypothetical protein
MLLQVGKIGCILTLLYTILILPIMLLYRSMEVEMTQTEETQQEDRRVRDNQKYPPLYQEGKQEYVMFLRRIYCFRCCLHANLIECKLRNIVQNKV